MNISGVWGARRRIVSSVSKRGRLYQERMPSRSADGLIVVMQKVYEPVGREMAAGFTASGKIHEKAAVALIGRAGCERAAKTVIGWLAKSS